MKLPESFLKAVSYVLKNEGGFIDDPDDPGGPTNYGITAKTFELWEGKKITHENVKDISLETALQIYFAKYWLPLSCDRIKNLPIAITMFDVAVLFGPGISAVFSQKALKAFGCDVIIDGAIGEETIKGFEKVDPNFFIKTMRDLLMGRINQVIEAHPKSEKYRKGWENRVDRLLSLA